ncbi:macrophage mannose receptor 1 [Plakobranchus ocellatus]|uniref:Macrophage mannose receptor 1 n=1 Tax=Plakobranchus ocellatus TaxID=259542 RepID=A0AAV3YL84_9GAST|nr:macrophage mannose receptor 1 [Plakobranchus ocellatus]
MNKFLKKHIRWWRSYYIGLHDTETENTWRWLNETETATFTKWARGQPNNWTPFWAKEGEDCVLMYRDRWYDALCSSWRRYICERTPSSSAPGECEPGWLKNPSSGTCKQWYRERKSWKDAKTTCQQEGGDLVTILDKTTNTFVNDMRKSNDRGTCWIGLNDLDNEGKFRWQNENQEVHYTNWSPGNPGQTNRQGQDCVVMGYKESEKWSLFDCMQHSSFICEKKGVCRFVDGVCPSGWFKGIGSCFKTYELKRHWKDARAVCQKDGGDLLTIRDECMTHHLEDKVNDGPYWIGLSDHKEEGTWRWLDESFTIIYTHWGPGQPSNHQTAGHKEGQDCVEIGSQKYKTQWNDADCTKAHKFICELPATHPSGVGAGVIIGIIIGVVTLCGAIVAAVIFGPRVYRALGQKTENGVNTVMSFSNPMARSVQKS